MNKKFLLLFLFVGISLCSCSENGIDDGDQNTDVTNPDKPNPDNDGGIDLDPNDVDAYDASRIIINLGEDFRDIDLKRGRLVDDAVSDEVKDQIAEMDVDMANGMTLSGLPKDLNQFSLNIKTDGSNAYLSYRSQKGAFGSSANALGCKGEQEEFSRNDDGSYNVRINSGYLALCKKAIEDGQQLLIPLCGVPSEGFDDGSVEPLVPLDKERRYSGGARFYPIPQEKYFEKCAEIIATYAKLLISELKEACDPQYHELIDQTVFFGTQEPTHTIGYINGVEKDDDGEENITAYLESWIYVAKELKECGILTGTCQLNAADQGYIVSTKVMNRKNIPFDYYSIQNYRGYENDEILNSARTALTTYGFSTDKRVIYNRYAVNERAADGSKSDNYNNGSDVIKYLKAEEIFFCNIDMVYGYCYGQGIFGYTLMHMVYKALNSAPKPQRRFSTMIKGLSGFVLGDEQKVSLFLWNESTTKTYSDFEIKLAGATSKYSDASILKLNNKEDGNYKFDGYCPNYEYSIEEDWDVKSQSIPAGRLELKPREILIIELTK